MGAGTGDGQLSERLLAFGGPYDGQDMGPRDYTGDEPSGPHDGDDQGPDDAPGGGSPSGPDDGSGGGKPPLMKTTLLDGPRDGQEKPPSNEPHGNDQDEREDK